MAYPLQLTAIAIALVNILLDAERHSVRVDNGRSFSPVAEKYL
jgi:hypothetical protein